VKTHLLLAAALAMIVPDSAVAQRNAPADAPFVLEHSCWLQSGETKRFVALFNKNKLPLLKREMAEGRVL